MARQSALKIYDLEGVNDFLAEKYGDVIKNISTGTVSDAVKNRNLSGDPEHGSVEAKRFANASVDEYGTARAGGKGKNVKADTVTIKINKQKELIEEVEESDVAFYGIKDLINQRNSNIVRVARKTLEKEFWSVAVDAATEIVTNETSITKIMDAAINTLETTKNDFVDGIDRDMLHFVVDPTTYTAIQEKLDELPNGTSPTDGKIQVYHNVKLFMSTDLPTGVKFVIGVDGSVAQPVRHVRQPYEKIQLSKAYAYGLYLDYGTKAVTPELLYYYADGVEDEPEGQE